MAFIKAVTRSDGTVHYYKVGSYRDPDTGKVRQKVLRSYGTRRPPGKQKGLRWHSIEDWPRGDAQQERRMRYVLKCLSQLTRTLFVLKPDDLDHKPRHALDAMIVDFVKTELLVELSILEPLLERLRRWIGGRMDKDYKLLGLDPGATEAEIRQAYRRVAKELHPDLHPGPRDRDAEDAFIRATEAYRKLTAGV